MPTYVEILKERIAAAEITLAQAIDWLTFNSRPTYSQFGMSAKTAYTLLTTDRGNHDQRA